MLKTLSPPVRRAVELAQRFTPNPDGSKSNPPPGTAIEVATTVMELTDPQLDELETAVRVADIELGTLARSHAYRAAGLGITPGTPELEAYLDEHAPTDLIEEMAAAILVLATRDRTAFLAQLTTELATRRP